MPALFRRRTGGIAGKIGQTCEIALLQHQRIGLLIGQHVLSELGAEAGHPLVDGRQAVLRRLVERAASPHESSVIAVEHARLLGVKAEAVAPGIQVGDAGVERAVEIECVAVTCQERRDVALDRLDGIAGVGAGQHKKDVGDVLEIAPAHLQRHDGVVEARRLRIGGDSVELGAVGSQSAVEGGTEMVRLDRRQRRQAEGAGPVGQQRVIGDGLQVIHAVHLAIGDRLG